MIREKYYRGVYAHHRNLINSKEEYMNMIKTLNTVYRLDLIDKLILIKIALEDILVYTRSDYFNNLWEDINRNRAEIEYGLKTLTKDLIDVYSILTNMEDEYKSDCCTIIYNVLYSIFVDDKVDEPLYESKNVVLNTYLYNIYTFVDTVIQYYPNVVDRDKNSNKIIINHYNLMYHSITEGNESIYENFGKLLFSYINRNNIPANKTMREINELPPLLLAHSSILVYLILEMYRLIPYGYYIDWEYRNEQ